MDSRRVVRGGAAAVAVACVALSGCTKATPTPTPSGPATPTVLAVSTTPLPPEPSWKSTPAGAAADVVWDKAACPKEKGTQTVKGTVKNSATEARDYNIMIIWMKNGSGTPLGAGKAVVQDLAPGEERAWEVTAQVFDKADECVPNVYAGQL